MNRLLALIGHPVTMALFDIARYAAMQHVIPALNQPSPQDIHRAASEYATGESYGPEIRQTGGETAYGAGQMQSSRSNAGEQAAP